MKINNLAVRKHNKQIVFEYMVYQEKVTRPEIAAATGLSLPTVGQITESLEKDGLISWIGMQDSSGGRRALGMRVNFEKFCALGIDITKNHITFAAVDLAGRVKACARMRKSFEAGAEYGKSVRHLCDEFLKNHGVSCDTIIGTGVSLPGIISGDQKYLLVSHALNMSSPLELITPEKTKNVRYFNDADAGCLAECFMKDMPENFNYLSLSNSVGGSMVIGGEIVSGAHRRSGEFGHVCIIPKGRKCYCGKDGHYDPYGSALLLAQHTEGDISLFFEKTAQGDEKLQKVLNEYIEYLALLLYNIHTSTDLPIVLGGYVGKYLQPYLDRIEQKVKEYDIFTEEDTYIFTSRYAAEGAALGCARSMIASFVENI